MSEGLISFIGLIVLFLVLYLWVLSNEKKKNKFSNYYDITENCMKNYENKSTSQLEESITKMHSVYQEAKDILPEASRKCYQYDLEDLQDQLKEKEMEKWERKALPHLEKVFDCWDQFTCGDIEVFDDLDFFKDSDYYIKLQKKCLNEWQHYFSIPTDSYKIKIHPKEYMREYFGENYDRCMDSYSSLDERLTEMNTRMLAESQRKKKLLRMITAYVKKVEKIQRSVLLKTEFAGFTVEEIRYGYKELVKKKRLCEEKIGKCYFAFVPSRKE